MDKVKTLEVLRGMKFMQRKEEAKRRATFEVAQREEIERHLHVDGNTGSSSSSNGDGASGGNAARGPWRATVLYDDVFPSSAYGLARQTFTDALGGPAVVEAHDNAAVGAGSSSSGTALGTDALHRDAVQSGDDDEEMDDLWGSDGEEGAEDVDPTAASRRKGGSKRGDAVHALQQKGGRGDGRFTVQSAVRAPKLPKRLEESVAEEERQRKRRRAEEEDDQEFC